MNMAASTGTRRHVGDLEWQRIIDMRNISEEERQALMIERCMLHANTPLVRIKPGAIIKLPSIYPPHVNTYGLLVIGFGAGFITAVLLAWLVRLI